MRVVLAIDIQNEDFDAPKMREASTWSDAIQRAFPLLRASELRVRMVGSSASSLKLPFGRGGEPE